MIIALVFVFFVVAEDVDDTVAVMVLTAIPFPVGLLLVAEDVDDTVAVMVLTAIPLPVVLLLAAENVDDTVVLSLGGVGLSGSILDLLGFFFHRYHLLPSDLDIKGCVESADQAPVSGKEEIRPSLRARVAEREPLLVIAFVVVLFIVIVAADIDDAGLFVAAVAAYVDNMVLLVALEVMFLLARALIPMVVMVFAFVLVLVARAIYARDDELNVFYINGDTCTFGNLRAAFPAKGTGQLNQDKFVTDVVMWRVYVPEECTGQRYAVIKHHRYDQAAGKIEPLFSWKPQATPLLVSVSSFL
ncbi:MAG: hypothetical protein RIN56_17245 [Sporomusaceae bacterium]|nr:hypothetical protein [Sporomusaceae bacterium]